MALPILIIFMPGIFSGPSYFKHKGFIEELARHDIHTDAVAVDLHSGYYRDRSLFERLRLDIIEPARSRGYRSIWLVGVSLGGLGALMTAREYPELIDGVFAIAPYLGKTGLIDEIEAAGGLDQWQPSAIHDPSDRYVQVWSWLRDRTVSQSPKPVIFLGYGDDDRFARAHRVLSSVIPRENVFVGPGGHYWRVWRRIFAQFLKTSLETGNMNPSSRNEQ